ncbi:MAG TPA: hypothetical protein VH877_12505 [Polyangia bacterium]|jgi:hypothetical protein|nr:hypothetical protein [Polyangia bacterium]
MASAASAAKNPFRPWIGFAAMLFTFRVARNGFAAMLFTFRVARNGFAAMLFMFRVTQNAFAAAAKGPWQINEDLPAKIGHP